MNPRPPVPQTGALTRLRYAPNGTLLPRERKEVNRVTSAGQLPDRVQVGRHRNHPDRFDRTWHRNRPYIAGLQRQVLNAQTGVRGERSWLMTPEDADWVVVEVRDADGGMLAVTNPIFMGDR